MAAPGELRIASANLQYGGIDPGGGTARLHQTLTALEEWQPHAVLLQEVTGLPPGPLDSPSWDMPLAERDRLAARAAERAHDAARDHLRHIAGRLGMRAVLGPPVPGQWRRMHTAILIRAGNGIEIAGTGPPPMAVPGAENPAWTQAAIQVPGISHLIDLYSVHLPARAAIRQRWQAEALASVIAQRGLLAHAAGDWNSIPRTDRPAPQQLTAMNPHLRPARMILDGGPLRPDYGIDDLLTGTGLTDIAAHLDPDALRATGPAGSRVDRHCATREMARAAVAYRQAATPGTDHHLTMTAYDRAAIALATPPGPRD
jgi:hypothetical protein